MDRAYYVGEVEANCLHFESEGEICTFQGGGKKWPVQRILYIIFVLV